MTRKHDVTISSAQAKYIRNLERQKRRIHVYQLLIAVVFFGLWEAATRVGWLDSFIFSSPARIVKTIAYMIKDGSFFLHLGITLGETFLSFILVLVFGILIAIALWWNKSVSHTVEPYLVALNSLPKTALAPMLIVWFGNNVKTIIVCAISLAVFSTIINLYTSFVSIDSNKILLIRTLGGKKKDILSKVILPGSVPSLISCMKVNIGLCLVGVIIGEFLAANAGLGYLIIYGSQVFKLDWVVMSIVVLCIVATGLYGLINVAEKVYRKRV